MTSVPGRSLRKALPPAGAGGAPWTSAGVRTSPGCKAWLDAQHERGRIQAGDTAATAAVRVASLTYYWVLQSLIGHSPGDIELDAYLTAWVDSAVATLNPGGS